MKKCKHCGEPIRAAHGQCELCRLEDRQIVEMSLRAQDDPVAEAVLDAHIAAEAARLRESYDRHPRYPATPQAPQSRGKVVRRSVRGRAS